FEVVKGVPVLAGHFFLIQHLHNEMAHYIFSYGICDLENDYKDNMIAAHLEAMRFDVSLVATEWFLQHFGGQCFFMNLCNMHVSSLCYVYNNFISFENLLVLALYQTVQINSIWTYEKENQSELMRNKPAAVNVFKMKAPTT
ncbi:hypothetical protein ACJX0J_016590, partial [Zea mays]